MGDPGPTLAWFLPSEPDLMDGRVCHAEYGRMWCLPFALPDQGTSRDLAVRHGSQGTVSEGSFAPLSPQSGRGDNPRSALSTVLPE